MDDVKETPALIAASKVKGVNVYNLEGEHIGAIDDVMIDKKSGRVSYAVMSFGGFLGLGANYHPLPWSMLKYDVNLGGYVVDVTDDLIKGAPAYAETEIPIWDHSYEKHVRDYYGVGPEWGSVN
jgi:sporulation protein YlmC with PRC-barrel domain